MHAEIACLLCAMPPGTVDMVAPVAQATIIAVPIVFRDHIRHGIRAARAQLAARREVGTERADESSDQPTDDAPRSGPSAS